ncbi:hypothetical protein B0G80_1890 [Paraburkholderia sp. BL6669N2]|nr:hypothetical protein B0G80_1890 [Paraburkholderia sp. BL6669N2]
MASISTVILPGSEPAPTAEREIVPRVQCVKLI